MAKAVTAVSEPTNGGKESIDATIPYVAHITIVGSADLLLHAWNCEAVEEKSSFNAHLTDSGATKVQVIKAVKDALGLGLKEAKDLVDATPTVLKEGMKKEDADKLKAAVEAAGGKVELK